MKLEVVGIPTAEGSLAGLRYLPGATTHPTALLFAHGFTSGKYSVDGLASYLALRGYEGLTFDLVGHKLGGSGGEMHRAAQAADNVRDALSWLQGHSTAQKVVLVGHSMGGAAVIQAAAQELIKPPRGSGPRLAGVVSLCVALEPARGFDSPIGKAMLSQRSDYVAGAPPATLLAELAPMLLAARQLTGLPTLFIAARQDVLVAPDRVEALAALAGPDATFTTVESSHLEAPDRSRAAIIAWLAAHF